MITVIPSESRIGSGRRRTTAVRPARLRPLIALTAAAAALVATLVGAIPALYALPLIGMLIAWSTSSVFGPEARALSLNSRNVAIGLLVLVALAAVAFQGPLERLLIVSLGMDLPSAIPTLLSIAVLALPVGMYESTSRVVDFPVDRMVATRRNLLLALTALVTVAAWHATVGLSFVVLAALVLVLPVTLSVSRFRHARHRVFVRSWPQPLGRDLGVNRLQLLNVVIFVALMGLAALVGSFDIIRLYLPVGAYPLFQLALGVALVVLVIHGLLPGSRVQLGTMLAVAAGSVFLASQLVSVFQPPSDPVAIVSPLDEEWYVSQGGRAELLNYHYVTAAQRDALDIVQVVDGRTHPAGSRDLGSYYIFGVPLHAPASGVVTSVVDDLVDQPIGSADHENPAGNHLVIEISRGRYLLLAHLREGSIDVEAGDRVTTGQVVAQVGNSGNTTEPHIHIQAFNLPSFETANGDLSEFMRTVRTYPLVLQDVALTRNGSQFEHSAVDPRRGDIIKPLR